MAKFVEIMNEAEYAQYTCYLMGSTTYDIASLVISQACPHIYAYNGNPTLRFTANAFVGTRFYSGRVHLEGRNNYTLKISSVCGHHCFENCSITARNVEFLVPISIYGSFFGVENSIFHTTTVEAFKDRPQLFIRDGIGRLIGNITFKSTNGLAEALKVECSHISFEPGDSGSIIKIAKQNSLTSSSPEYPIQFDDCFIQTQINSITYTGSGSTFEKLLLVASSTLVDHATLFTSLGTKGYTIEKTAVFQNGLPVFCGNSYTINKYIDTGYVSSGSSVVNFTIKLPFHMKDNIVSSSNISITYTSAALRGIQGYLHQVTGTNYTTTDYTIVCSYSSSQGNELACTITLPSNKTNVVNNTPVNVLINGLKIHINI